jgi:hypothetical protein
MPRRGRGEDGVSLILALAFLSLFALFIPRLLDLAATNMLATSRLQGQRSSVYAADAATEGAIQYLRTHSSCGRLGGGSCPIANFSASLNGTTATTNFSFSGSAIDFDRTFDLTTTDPNGKVLIRATVIIRDSNPGNAADVPVDVKSWTYVR